eukprot:3698138-Karenia_brevis.AAC.1
MLLTYAKAAPAKSITADYCSKIEARRREDASKQIFSQVASLELAVHRLHARLDQSMSDEAEWQAQMDDVEYAPAKFVRNR